jgi:hypothetical protein
MQFESRAAPCPWNGGAQRSHLTEWDERREEVKFPFTAAPSPIHIGATE